MHSVVVEIAPSPSQGPNYVEIGGYTSIKWVKAIIVKGGMVNGASTVDLQFEATDGSKFVALTPISLLKGLVAADGEAKEQRISDN